MYTHVTKQDDKNKLKVRKRKAVEFLHLIL